MQEPDTHVASNNEPAITAHNGTYACVIQPWLVPDTGGGWFVVTTDGMVRAAGPALVKDWTVGTGR
jgi:hypothetical protein